jgi:hypothetical protein
VNCKGQAKPASGEFLAEMLDFCSFEFGFFRKGAAEIAEWGKSVPAVCAARQSRAGISTIFS